MNNGHVIHLTWIGTHVQFNQKKSPNIYKSCPKLISLEKLKILSPLQKLLKNVGDLGKLIVAKGFKKLPKVQKITQSGHTAHVWLIPLMLSLTKEEVSKR